MREKGGEAAAEPLFRAEKFIHAALFKITALNRRRRDAEGREILREERY
ncbi:TPA: hypothetical protein HA351_11815 [Methanosarcinaceae archaeon]|nr:hypothetical protein [Methanosarcinaceae archaeon]